MKKIVLYVLIVFSAFYWIESAFSALGFLVALAMWSDSSKTRSFFDEILVMLSFIIPFLIPLASLFVISAIREGYFYKPLKYFLFSIIPVFVLFGINEYGVFGPGLFLLLNDENNFMPYAIEFDFNRSVLLNSIFHYPNYGVTKIGVNFLPIISLIALKIWSKRKLQGV